MTSGQLTQTPHNVATMVGHSVTLICAGNTLKWTELITSSVNPQDIATGGEILNKSRYSLNTEPAGNYSLIVTSPELKDGGQYRCSYKQISTNYGDAEVIVFGKAYFDHIYIYIYIYMLHIFIHHGCSLLTPGVSFTKIKHSFIGKSIMKQNFMSVSKMHFTEMLLKSTVFKLNSEISK